MITAGIDAGSRYAKAVLLREGEVLASAVEQTGVFHAQSAQEALDRALCEAGLDNAAVDHLCATGMGRHLVDFADSRVTDVTATSLACARLFPGARAALDIGAEECRLVITDGAGRMLDSAISDRCASGTGAFLEAMARILNMTLEEFSTESLSSVSAVEITSQCAVFAESEVVSLVHANVPAPDIARAIHSAIAHRVAALYKRLRPSGAVALLGGMALDAGFVKRLSEALPGVELLATARPDLGPALGAAIYAQRRAEKTAGKNG